MARPPALLEDLRIDAFSVVFYGNAKFAVSVLYGHVDPRGLRVAERIAKSLRCDAVNLIPQDRMQLPLPAFDYDCNSRRRTFGVSGSRFLAQRYDRAGDGCVRSS